ncbi:MAG: RNA polymerase factor sigma-54 [Puniceicoccales bacterium]|jgi:RNA polymerase sigma-54 factor|nr:RNA polymerase factor sigma-54 [Puniceicoccales bacterium]
MQPTISNVQGMHQTQRQTQSINLTPQLRQSLHILQLSTVALNQEIAVQLAENPLLEEVRPADCATDSLDAIADARRASERTAGARSETDAAGDASDFTADSTFLPDAPARRDNAENADFGDADFTAGTGAAAGGVDAAAGVAGTTPSAGLEGAENGVVADRDEYGDAPAGSASADLEERRQALFDNATQNILSGGQSISLDAFLVGQARAESPPPAVLAAFETIIGEIDARGFFNADIGHLCLASAHARADLEAALALLKTLDPPGIGAADLRECFLLQLARRGLQKSTAARLVEKCFPLLLKRQIPAIAEKLEVTTAAVRETFAVLASLDTAPARRFERDDNRALLPDVTVRRAADGVSWDVSLNNERLPLLRLNQTYKDLAASKSVKESDRQFITAKMRDGRFFITAIEQRQRTLERIARAMVAHQGDFLENGLTHLRPLTMSALASEIGVHETTVGRAIDNKNIATPHGVFAMRYFFRSGLATADGGEISAESVQRLIREIIAGESPAAPFSDTALFDELNRRGVQIARRTVTKYRIALNLPPSHMRKEV